MEELHKIVKKKYKDFNITPQHLGQVIRDNNITRKRTRHEHYPKERYGKPTDIKKELKAFYKEVSKYSLDKIISFSYIFFCIFLIILIKLTHSCSASGKYIKTSKNI